MQFSSFVLTAQGQALMSKLMSNVGTCDFTSVKLSKTEYQQEQLESIEELSEIVQVVTITKKSILNNTSIVIEAATDNMNLTSGYLLQSIGLYATDQNNSEILFAVAKAISPCFLPPFNGTTVSGAYFKFVLDVRSTENLVLTVDPAGYASIDDIRNIRNSVVNNLTTTESGYILDARQGRALSDAVAGKMDIQRGEELALEIAGKASTAVYSATLTASGWSTTVPRKQTVNVAGILATDTPFVDIDMSGATTGAAGTALTDAWTLVGRVEAGAGNVTAYCYDDVPTVDLPIVLKVVR